MFAQKKFFSNFFLKFFSPFFQTGGLVDPSNNHSRLSPTQAVKLGWIDEKRANRLKDPSRVSRQIISPTTGLLISYYDTLIMSIPDHKNNLHLEAVPKSERRMRLGNAEIKAYSCASSMVSSIAASNFVSMSNGLDGSTTTINMGAF